MKKLVEVFGKLEQIEIIEKKKLLKKDVRYVGTDQGTQVSVYEDRQTGEYWGCYL